MIVYAEVECILYNAQSLKEKRSIIKSVVQRVRNDFNVSIAEIDHLDLWQRTTLGIAAVADDYQYAEKLVQAVLKRIDSNPELERTLTAIERL